MLSIGSVVVNVSDVRRAVDFWTAALDYVLRYPVEDDWAILRPRAGGGPNLSLNLGETVPTPSRVHLDLYAGDHDDQSAEVRRLIDLGATHVEWDYPEDGTSSCWRTPTATASASSTPETTLRWP